MGDCPANYACANGWNGFRYCQEPPKPQILLAKASVAGPVAKPGGSLSVGASASCSSAGGLSLFPFVVLLAARRRRVTRSAFSRCSGSAPSSWCHPVRP